MLILAAGLVGLVALPFLILMLPMLLWLLVPTVVFFGGAYALRVARRHQALVPLHRS
jgi:hypothetical protein